MKKRNIRGAEGIAKRHEKSSDTLGVSEVRVLEEQYVEISEEYIENFAKDVLNEYMIRNNVRKTVEKWQVRPGFFGPAGQFTMYAGTYSSKTLGWIDYNSDEKMKFAQKDFDTMSVVNSINKECLTMGAHLEEIAHVCGHTKYMGGLSLLLALISSDNIKHLPEGEYIFPNALFTNEQEQWCTLIVTIRRGEPLGFDLYPLEKETYVDGRRVLVVDGKSQISGV